MYCNTTIKIINNINKTLETTLFFSKRNAFSFQKFHVFYRTSRDITMFREDLCQPILPTSNWKLLFHFVNIGLQVIFQSMWNSTVSTVTWLWAGRCARELFLLQNIHTSYISHTFFYSICTTGSIPDSGQRTSVTIHLHLIC
jgi:hypothetical protein